MNLLLLSSSRVDGTEYLQHAKSLIQSHLTNHIKTALFIPYAGVGIGFDKYEEMVADPFSSFGYQVKSIHNFDNPAQAVLDAEAILVGGGNTFCLLNNLYENNLIAALKEKVSSGTPYIGWSAGSNIAAPTIKTTNDMPIIEPPSFDALNFLSCQLNPHYLDGNPPGHQGETREQRISEFLAVNPAQHVVGLPEGTALITEGNELVYQGAKTGYIFSADKGKQPIESGHHLTDFLNK